MIVGRLLGFIFGLGLAGPIGALAGILIGYQFDKGLEAHLENVNEPEEEAKNQGSSDTFFTALFQMMGHLAKADGRVNEREIASARGVMQRLQLSAIQRQTAMRAFNEGKAADFQWRASMVHFQSTFRYRWPIRQLFLEILIESAYADGQLKPGERLLLQGVSEVLRFSPGRLAEIEARFRAQQDYSFFHQQQDNASRSGHHSSERQTTYGHTSGLAEAYRLLGAKPDDTDSIVKRAYRKRISEHHPDKLISKGLPPDMIRLATEKTQIIQQAYEQICRSRAVRERL